MVDINTKCFATEAQILKRILPYLMTPVVRPASCCKPYKFIVVSVTGHFVPRSFRTILVISYPRFGHFVPSNIHFVPRSFHTLFGHFVPSSTGYEITFESQFVPKSFRTYFGHFVPTLSFRTRYVISYLGSVNIIIIYLN